MNPETLTSVERLQYEGFLRREEMNMAVQALADEGVPIKQIVLRTGPCARRGAIVSPFLICVLTGEDRSGPRRRLSSQAATIARWAGPVQADTLGSRRLESRGGNRKRDMVARSAGILLYRAPGPDLRVLLVHPGGPYWARKDAGAWSIPKGEHDPDEARWTAALREFEEETGMRLAADSPRLDLGEIRQAGGKRVTAFAVEGDLDPAGLRSNRFSLEWPPGSGRSAEYPEVDRAEWFSIPVAREKIIAGQRPFVECLVDGLSAPG